MSLCCLFTCQILFWLLNYYAFSSISKQPVNQQHSCPGLCYYASASQRVPSGWKLKRKQASIPNVAWYQCLTNTIRIKFILKINNCSTDWGYTLRWINKKPAKTHVNTSISIAIVFRKITSPSQEMWLLWEEKLLIREFWLYLTEMLIINRN